MNTEHTVEEECPEWQIAIASIVAGAKTNGTSVNETTRQILEVVTSLHHSHTEEVEQARREAYAHCAIIREREINDILFEVADEARDSFGNGEKVIRKWMEKNNCEVHPLLIKD